MALEAWEKRAARVSSTALVRYRSKDYLAPTSHGFQEVLVKGLLDHVIIACAAQQIARDPRVYGSCSFVFDPLHYLALIESKPDALGQAGPLKALLDRTAIVQRLSWSCTISPWTLI